MVLSLLLLLPTIEMVLSMLVKTQSALFAASHEKYFPLVTQQLVAMAASHDNSLSLAIVAWLSR